MAMSRQHSPDSLLRVSAGTCQRALVDKSGMIRTQMGSTIDHKMVAVYGTLCKIPHRKRNGSEVYLKCECLCSVFQRECVVQTFIPVLLLRLCNSDYNNKMAVNRKVEYQRRMWQQTNERYRRHCNALLIFVNYNWMRLLLIQGTIKIFCVS
jgi:hypothetical protein